MQYEVRKSGGPACPSCGAFELVSLPRTAEGLRVVVKDHIEQEASTLGFFRRGKKRRMKQVVALTDELVESLRKKTYLV